MNNLQTDIHMPNLMRTVRDDISLQAVHAAFFINHNKQNTMSRSFYVDVDKHIEGDGARLTASFIESFIDALIRVYSGNVVKLNGYSFRISYPVKDESLPSTAWLLMQFCTKQAAECGISVNKVAFGKAMATTDDNNESNICVDVYIAPFTISKADSINISALSRFRLFTRELYRILFSK